MAKARKKTPEWKRLISRCQKLWEAYDKAPTKKRLEAFGAHLEKMKASKSIRVRSERARASRAFRSEWKGQGYASPRAPRARPRRVRNPKGTPLRREFEELVGVSPADATMGQWRDYQRDGTWPAGRTVHFRLWTVADRKAFTDIANELIDLGFAIDYEYFPKSQETGPTVPKWSRGMLGESERLQWMKSRGGDMEVVVVPKLGIGVKEAGVSEWLKREGAFVEVGDPLIELDTDTSTIEVKAPERGVLMYHLVEVDQMVSPGDELAKIHPVESGPGHSRGEIMIQSRSLPLPMDRILAIWSRHADSEFDAWVDAADAYSGPEDANDAAEALLEEHGGKIPDIYGRLLLREGGDVGEWQEPGDV